MDANDDQSRSNEAQDEPSQDSINLAEIESQAALSEGAPSDPLSALKVSRGLGVASVCFLLLSLLLWTLFAGVNVWVELEIRRGYGNFEEIFETRRMWYMIIVPFGTLSWTSAFILLGLCRSLLHW